MADAPLLPFDPIAEARRQWESRWGGAPVASMSAVTSIMRAEQILIARLNELLKPFELTFPRYEALMILHFSRAGALPLGKLGARLQVHRTSVTNTIDGLEAAGYVERRAHDEDRRTTLAAITPKGHKVAEASTDALNQAKFGTVPLSKADLLRITETLERLRSDADGIEPGQPRG